MFAVVCFMKDILLKPYDWSQLDSTTNNNCFHSSTSNWSQKYITSNSTLSKKMSYVNVSKFIWRCANKHVYMWVPKPQIVLWFYNILMIIGSLLGILHEGAVRRSLLHEAGQTWWTNPKGEFTRFDQAECNKLLRSVPECCIPFITCHFVISFAVENHIKPLLKYNLVKTVSDH